MHLVLFGSVNGNSGMICFCFWNQMLLQEKCFVHHDVLTLKVRTDISLPFFVYFYNIFPNPFPNSYSKPIPLLHTNNGEKLSNIFATIHLLTLTSADFHFWFVSLLVIDFRSMVLDKENNLCKISHFEILTHFRPMFHLRTNQVVGFY